MVDRNVKPFVCLVARRNSMKMIIGCVIPLQMRVLVRVRVNLDAAHARRMKF